MKASWKKASRLLPWAKASGKKASKKKGVGKAKKDDWVAARQKFVFLDVRNAQWNSMRFVQPMPENALVADVLDIVIERHKISEPEKLKFHLGEKVEADTLVSDHFTSLSAYSNRVSTTCSLVGLLFVLNISFSISIKE